MESLMTASGGRSPPGRERRSLQPRPTPSHRPPRDRSRRTRPDHVDAHENDLIRSEEQAAQAKCSFTLHDNGDGTSTGHFTVPALAAAILAKILDTMTAPRRMRAPGSDNGTPDRSFDWRHRRGLVFAELLEHLPTDHLHPKLAATVIVTIDHTVLTGAMKAARLDTGESLSAGEARRLACNAAILPAVLSRRSLPSTSATQPGSSPSPRELRKGSSTRLLRCHRLRMPVAPR